MGVIPEYIDSKRKSATLANCGYDHGKARNGFRGHFRPVKRSIPEVLKNDSIKSRLCEDPGFLYGPKTRHLKRSGRVKVVGSR
jgi:hypothetical protein